MTCILNGLDNCYTSSIPGVRRMFLTPFGGIYDYIYDQDNLGKVTDFKTTILPLEYKIAKGSFTEDYNRLGVRTYNHKLSVNIPKMDYLKRNEFEEVIGNKLTIIFEDYNGKCWIIGFDKPLKTSKFNSVSGGDSNGYLIEFEGISNYQIKEINCYDASCFASFNGLEQRVSTFNIESASTYDFSTIFQITADENVLSLTPLNSLDPVNWSNPVIYAQDLLSLQGLIGNPSTFITLTYDSFLDIATIVFVSTDTTYDNLSFNSQLPNLSVVNITLNLSFVLSLGLLNAVIDVKDSTLTTIYSGNPLDPVIGLGLSGIVENAFINVSELYPNGETFTAEITGINCPIKTYTFIYENSSSCGFDTEVGYYLGRTYTIEIPKSTFIFEYRFVCINFDEFQWLVINSPTSDFLTFESNLTTAISINPNNSVDLSSLEILDLGDAVKVKFVSSRSGSILTAQVALDLTIKEVIGYTESSLLNVISYVNSDSQIKITDTLSNYIVGNYGTIPLNPSNQFEIETIPTISNGLIEDISFDVNVYDETDPFTMTFRSLSCPQTSFVLDDAVCYGTTDLAITRKYQRYEFDTNVLGRLNDTDCSLGLSFFMDYDLGTNFYIPITLTSDINSYGNYFQNFIENVYSNVPLYNGDYPIKIISFYFDFMNYIYILELDISIDVIINHIEVEDLSSEFTFLEEWDITEVVLNPIMNPKTTIQWTGLNDIDGNPINETGFAMDDFLLNRSIALNPAIVNYNLGTGFLQIDVNFLNIDLFTFECYDITNTLIFQISYPTPTITDNFDLANGLVANGKTINDVVFMVVSNSAGGYWIIPFNWAMDSNVDLPFSDIIYFKNIWGRFDSWKNLTPPIFIPVPFVLSVLCP